MRDTPATIGLTAAAVLAAAVPAGAGGPVTMETVIVGDPANAADPSSGLGAVVRRFRVGLFEVTNAQYVELLNAVAADDVHGLYNELMTTSDRGGILRSGVPGAYSYSLKPNFGNKPVGSVSWLDAARFCNWLHNGRPSGAQDVSTTEDGAYDMSEPDGDISRRSGATWFLPTHDEWYKAAYYDPFDPGADAGGTPDYWFYPTRSDVLPAQALADRVGDVVNPGPNVANHSGGADWNDENGNVTTAGGCEAPAPWGAFDLGGNINEWTETLGVPIPPNPPEQPDPLPTRFIRGGDFANPAALLGSPAFLAPDTNMVAEGANIGFRVAATGFLAGDTNGDGLVDGTDLVAVILAWGPCPPAPAVCGADSNADGVVDGVDLVTVILNWDD